METEKDTNTTTPEDRPAELSLGSLIGLFLFSTYISILPTSTVVYVFYSIMDPIGGIMNHDDWLFPAIIITAGLALGYIVLVFSSWGIARLSLRIVTKGKPVTETVFENNYMSNEWREFTLRHVVKKFSMWIFQKHVPRSLYRAYMSSFIKIGKHVELPEWTPMELAEIGNNTVFARQVILTSHLINGDKIVVSPVKVGNNCIIDSEDEETRVGISCGVVIEDNVIIKPGTFVPKGTVLEAGGIYQGDTIVERVGNTADLTSQELDEYRAAVRRKRELKSRMVDDWNAFGSKAPRVISKASKGGGFIIAMAFLLSTSLLLFPYLIQAFGWLGHVINIILLPGICFVTYGLYIFFPVGFLYAAMKHYEKNVPRLPVDAPLGEMIEITDPETIERWRVTKWLKWQAVNRVNECMFPDTSMLIYQRIGNNDVAFRTVLYVSRTDTDHVKIGDNTLISFGAHIYAYAFKNENGKEKLILKKTVVGKNCVLASSIIHAGARIGDNVTLGCHTVVPEDAVLEPGNVYVGNPAMEWNEFLEWRKSQKEIRKLGQP